MNQEPIAIIGINLRFPQADTLDKYWYLLKNEINVIDKYNRYKNNPNSTILGGFLEDIDKFDADFFKISSEESSLMSPEYRLLLESTWLALEDAGIIPQNIAGSDTAVFIGMSRNDYYLQISQIGINSFVATTGNSSSMAANRISYHFDFHGASACIDTACSSALVAIDNACRNLWTKDSSLALAGSANLILSDKSCTPFKEAGMIAPDGLCKVFDTEADGYVQSEGVAMLVLKPLSQALQDGDRIYGTIIGSGVNHNGRSNTLTGPNLKAQIALLDKVYNQGKIDPQTIKYIEAHAVGTPIGDALELKAIGKVLGKNRSCDNPCKVGSVKTNLGHTEGVSGMTGLIKILLCLQHRQLVPNLHFKQPSIALDKLRLTVQDKLEELDGDNFPLRMAVSAFGFGGTNAHIVVEEPPKPLVNTSEVPINIFTISATSKSALLALAEKYVDFLTDNPTVSLTNLCYTANSKRTQFIHRFSIVTDCCIDLVEQLQNFLNGNDDSYQKINHKKRQKLTFFCPSTIDVAFIAKLWDNQAFFREIWTKCQAILAPYLQISISTIGQIDHHFATFITEYSLAKLWESWGIQPDVIVASGVGEYVAACLTNLLSLEEVLLLMIGKDIEINYDKKPKVAIISAHTGSKITTTQLREPQYWQQTRLTTETKDLSYLEPNITNIVLELGDGQIQSELAKLKTEKLGLFSLSDNSHQSLLYSISQLWLVGIEIDWSGVYCAQHYQVISLPLYPFAKKSFWFDIDLDKNQSQAQSLASTESSYHFSPSNNTYVPPRNDTEQKLVRIWQNVLNIEAVGIDDNFFDLGGSSKTAAELFQNIYNVFHQDLSLSTIFEFPTIKTLAPLMEQDQYKAVWDCLVPIQEEGSKIPLFCIPGILGNIICYYDLADHLGKEDHPVYGLQALGLNGITKPLDNLKDIAAKYIQEIQTIQSEGPYCLAGHSFGGYIALEMAKQLEEQGHLVAFVALLDTRGPNARKSPKLAKPAQQEVNPSKLPPIIGYIHNNNLLKKYQRKIENISYRLNTYFQINKAQLFWKIGKPLPHSLRYFTINRAFRQSIANWKLGGLQTQVILFRGVEEDDKFHFDLGWKNLLHGQLIIHELPGHHLSILRGKSVEIMAQKLTSLLN